MGVLKYLVCSRKGCSKLWNSKIFTVRISLPTAIALTAVANPFNPYHGHEGLTQLNSSQSNQSLFEVVFQFNLQYNYFSFSLSVSLFFCPLFCFSIFSVSSVCPFVFLLINLCANYFLNSVCLGFCLFRFLWTIL